MIRVTTAEARKLGVKAKRPREKAKGDYKLAMEIGCKAHGLPVPIAEFKFSNDRLWRLDFVWIVGNGQIWQCDLVALEIQGGIWLKRGGHSGGKAQLDDMEKFNAAQLAGITVLQCTPSDIKTGAVFELLKKALQ